MPELPFSPADLAAVLAPLERASPLPAAAYHDPGIFEHERTAIFERAWLPVGRAEDVAHPGQWLRAPVTPEGVVVVRGVDLELHAFYNVCQHRAAMLLSGDSGRLQEVRCPYHGWTYELSGALREAPHAPPGFRCASHALSRVKVDVWQGFVFVAEDGSIAPLATAIAPLPPWLAAAPLAHATRAHSAAYEVAANWKLLVENFQESHHFTRIHPALERLTPNEGARSVLSPGPWLGGTMAFADGVETVSRSGTRRGRPFLAPSAYRKQVSDALLFPSLLTSLQPDYLLTYRLYPLGPASTRVVAETFVHPSALAGQADLEDLIAFWEVVNGEDRAICESQQVGVRSRGYRASGYTSVEDGVHAFDGMVARAYQSIGAARAAPPRAP